ncbi:MAG TPA: hypothetical protein VFZ23_13500 [Pyrinomonadaceae bacterium]
MRRFIVSVLGVTVFCIGLGALVENVGARFKSDEKALALIRQARLAIGGEQSIGAVRSMIIKGSSVNTIKIGTETRTEPGEIEIAMQLPDKLSKMVKIGRHDDAATGEKIIDRKHDVVIFRHEGQGEAVPGGERKVFVRKVEGDGHGEVEKIIAEGKNGEFTTSDGNKIIIRQTDAKDGERADGAHAKRFEVLADAKAAHTAQRQNELLRTTLSLLLTAPEGMDVTYTFVGEGDVDGTTCNIVNASFGGSNIKLYLSKASSLPVMVSYQGDAIPRVRYFVANAPERGDAAGTDIMTFKQLERTPETAEFNVRFSDYRGVNGVQLPYKWTTSIGGQVSEVFDVASYEINPANIAEKFHSQKVMVRKKKDVN